MPANHRMIDEHLLHPGTEPSCRFQVPFKASAFSLSVVILGFIPVLRKFGVHSGRGRRCGLALTSMEDVSVNQDYSFQ